jgi:hypothetical protein
MLSHVNDKIHLENEILKTKEITLEWSWVTKMT